MAQQLPVGLYRIGTTMDEIWSRVNAIDAISCVMWDESGSRRWRAEQLVKVVQWSYAHHWNRLLTAESVGLSNKDSGVTLNKLSLYRWICDFPSIDTFSTVPEDSTYFS